MQQCALEVEYSWHVLFEVDSNLWTSLLCSVCPEPAFAQLAPWADRNVAPSLLLVNKMRQQGPSFRFAGQSLFDYIRAVTGL